MYSFNKVLISLTKKLSWIRRIKILTIFIKEINKEFWWTNHGKRADGQYIDEDVFSINCWLGEHCPSHIPCRAVVAATGLPENMPGCEPWLHSCDGKQSCHEKKKHSRWWDGDHLLQRHCGHEGPGQEGQVSHFLTRNDPSLRKTWVSPPRTATSVTRIEQYVRPIRKGMQGHSTLRKKGLQGQKIAQVGLAVLSQGDLFLS